MKRIAVITLVLLSFGTFACQRDATQVANTATDDTMSTGPTTNTSTSAPKATPTDTTGTPISATGT